MKLSIIVPVYQVEAHIDECITSILDQTFRDFELILVDDGSLDRCPAICDVYAQKDSRIRVIHQKNQGLSAARNTGLQAARGDYIGFVDSDDFIEASMYEKLLDNLEREKADISVCGRYKVWGDKKIQEQKSNVYKVMDSAQALALMNTNVLGYFDVAAWDKIYKRSCFKGIEFPEGKLCEDWFVMYKLFFNAHRIVYDSIPLYNYRQRTGSITHGKKVNTMSLAASLEVLNFVRTQQPRYVREAQFAYVFAGIGVIDNYIEQSSIDRKSIDAVYKKIKPYLQTTYRYPGLKGKRKVQLFMVKKAMPLYICCFKWIKRRMRG
ncbi:glycosyltransferase [Faecalicoccus pleomorphus]|uniref:Glycosyltransferase n=2 Tax=Faecalicoccus pleomorphus TaxID=1323 RepID=A0A3E3E7D1_9FIRM|nr:MULTISPECIES: glycosyltransferase [Faecalicoccus]MDY5109889.1 glycosyltransferase [Faecalicoccus sp.]MDY5233391.1 glycosyltransferase [Faecalicoccus sp.]RGD77902.1 glycosyltransferase [Faecalicoccus pleomorphus]